MNRNGQTSANPANIRQSSISGHYQMTRMARPQHPPMLAGGTGDILEEKFGSDWRSRNTDNGLSIEPIAWMDLWVFAPS